MVEGPSRVESDGLAVSVEKAAELGPELTNCSTRYTNAALVWVLLESLLINHDIISPSPSLLERTIG